MKTIDFENPEKTRTITLTFEKSFNTFNQLYKYYRDNLGVSGDYVLLNNIPTIVSTNRKNYFRLRMDPGSKKEYAYFHELQTKASKLTNENYLVEIHLS